MTEFDVLSAAASGMDAERAALDVAARNVAAAETGGTFARLVPRFEVLPSGDADEMDFDRDREPSGSVVRYAGTTSGAGVEADAITEMVAVLNAQRAYEANASVFDAGKRLAERTIDLARL
jgi:flagellar basal body rod protein FlgC